MHSLLALTAVHERHSSISLPARRSLQESFHWTRCTALFNQRLNLPIEPQDRDALWGTAAALAIVSFASLDAVTPEDSWPLKPSEPSDLEWLRMGDGKKALWRLTNPLRPDSIFKIMASTFAEMHSQLTTTSIDCVPIALARLCNLDGLSTAESNPYFTAVHAVIHLQCLPDEQLTPGRALSFLSHVPTAYKLLLQKKDPTALLILLLWYCRARRAIWWIDARARIECPAILLYLRQYHKDNAPVQALLPSESVDSIWNQRIGQLP